jgi:hypothetical protein
MAGLQQLMAGARKFNLSEIRRDDLFAVTAKTQRETNLKFITEAGDDIERKS